jgi:imidazolonepropionase-like amidohydrolase
VTGFSVLAVFVMCALSAVAQQRETSVAIGVKTGKLLDVRTGHYAVDQTIWIEGDRIKAVGKSADIDREMPSSRKMIDLSNATVLPGLIDCHVHLNH